MLWTRLGVHLTAELLDALLLGFRGGPHRVATSHSAWPGLVLLHGVRHHRYDMIILDHMITLARRKLRFLMLKFMTTLSP